MQRGKWEALWFNGVSYELIQTLDYAEGQMRSSLVQWCAIWANSNSRLCRGANEKLFGSIVCHMQRGKWKLFGSIVCHMQRGKWKALWFNSVPYAEGQMRSSLVHWCAICRGAKEKLYGSAVCHIKNKNIVTGINDVTRKCISKNC